jgi:hypothetical protein
MKYRHIPQMLILFGIAICIFLLPPQSHAELIESAGTTSQQPPAWLEPQGLNLATLTGLLPESHLADTMISWIPGFGTVEYVSGVTDGPEIEVTVRYDLKNRNEVWCLAEPPQFDHSGTVQPPSTMRVYSNGSEITSKIMPAYTYNIAGQTQPNGGALTFGSRYANTTATAQFATDGALIVPANRGCVFKLDKAYPNVTAKVRMAAQTNISITEVFRYEKNIHSYIGPGATGSLASLQSQMSAKYARRHEAILTWFDLSDAEKAAILASDYLLVKFPAVGYDPYRNGGESYGTYRIAFNTSFYEWLSLDHVSAKLIPRLGHWRDADTQQGQPYLEFFQALWQHGNNIYENFDAVKSAELILPPGIAYQPCMTNGGCSDALLTQIFNHTYKAEVYFYKVERVKDGGLVQVPLKSVGNTYSPSATAQSDVSASEQPFTAPFLADHFVYLPLILKADPPPPPDNPNVCPAGCGWFDEYGQMLDFVPPVSWPVP